jgi:hypothetical protein
MKEQSEERQETSQEDRGGYIGNEQRGINRVDWAIQKDSMRLAK